MLDFKKILSSIADIGQSLLGKKFSKNRDFKSLLSLCDDLISYKGTASGIAIAREISEIYKILDTDQKLSFFKEINKKYKPNLNNIDNAIKKFTIEKSKNNLDRLGEVIEGRRQELIRRLNMAPNGTSILVSMREDLLNFIKQNPDLKDFDQDIRHLFKSWFNPGFLRLERITWNTKAAVLEKIIKYEKVHKIRDMNDLKRRLDEDRRFYAYFHPVLTDEPLIFVQVAFGKGLGRSIQELLKPSSGTMSTSNTATFYSISNCQEGLMRVTLGNFLIKRVVYEIQNDCPNIKHFGTLSPLPGFRKWCIALTEEKLKSILNDFDTKKLEFLKSDNFNNLSDKIEEQKNSIKKLVVHYLLKEKINKKPLNQVSRFHLGNGASIDDVIINGNTTDYGYKESFGIMVNYIYKLDKLEKIHEDYINHKKISYSDKIKKYV